MTTCFITATGTDVGKTFVTCALIRAARRRGMPVRALKPVASGFDPHAAAASDAGQLLAALGRPLDGDAIAAMSPWRFTAPLSPDMAAAREGRRIEWSALTAWCRREIADAERDGALLLIEGIGGIKVPLDERRTVLDLLEVLAVPALLVAGSYLGTLSHTLTAADVLKARGVTVAAVAMSESAASPVPLAETLDAVRRFVAPLEVLGIRRRTAAAEDHNEDDVERVLDAVLG